MTREKLEAIYSRNYKQAGDTEKDFYEWAIGYLLLHLDRIENQEICP